MTASVPDARWYLEPGRPQRSCTSKMRHPSKQAAARMRRRMRAEGLDLDRALQIYKCPGCAGYHLGRRRTG